LQANDRKEIIRRRIAFEQDPASYAWLWADAESALKTRIGQARAVLPEVRLANQQLDQIAKLCAEAGVEGLRADIVTYKTARAIAALEGHPDVTASDVHEALEFALPHRRRTPAPPPARVSSGEVRPRKARSPLKKR